MEFNEQQKQAINFKEGNCLVNASSGSGKTSVLVNRIAKLVNEDKVDPSEILAITFTKNAGENLVQRLKKLGVEGIATGTYHSICYRILASNGITIKSPIDFKIQNEFKKVQRGKSVSSYFGIMGFISYQKSFDRGVDDEFVVSNSLSPILEEYTIEQLREFYRAYEELKAREGWLDFDDYLLKARDLLREDKRNGTNKIKTYEYLLVDEYQDNNNVQEELSKLLCKGNNVFTVGDVKQCLLPDTLIRTSKGFKPIKDIEDSDELVVANGRGNTTLADYPELLTKEYEGSIINIHTESGKVLKCTPNHIIFAERDIDSPYYVYMMYRPDYGFRVGQTKKHKSGRNGFEKRLTDETGERAWCLRVCDTVEEASYWENYYAFEYGIPLTVFEHAGRGISMSQETISKLFNSIDTRQRALKLLSDLNMYFDYPHYTPKADSKHIDIKINFNMFGCTRCAVGKTSDYKGYTHELQINTTNEEYVNKINGNTEDNLKTFIDRWNGAGTHYWSYVKSGGDYDEIERQIEILQNSQTENCKNILVTRKALLTSNGKFFFQPASNIRKGSVIAIYENGKVIEDTVTEVVTTQYKGLVYDINVKDYRNYFAGDICVHNCLYGFNGSNSHIFMDFPKKNNATVIDLYMNYRSCNNIVEISNRFIAPYYKDFENYRDSEAFNKEDGNIVAMDYRDEEEEARGVADKIEEALKNGVKPNEIMVLYRNNIMSGSIEMELRQRNIPFDISKEGSFFKRREIDIILCVLRLMSNPSDDIAYEQLVRYRCYPFNYVRNVAIEMLSETAYKKDSSLLLAYQYSNNNIKPQEKTSFSTFHSIVTRLNSRKLNGMPLSSIIDSIVNDLHLKDYIREKSNTKEDLQTKLDSIAKIKALAKNKELNQFLSYCYDTKNIIKKKENKEEQVRLMTIHKSKGLESQIVFVIGVNAEKFPSMIEGDGESEANLFYVAITRAKEELYVSSSNPSQYFSKFINLLEEYEEEKCLE